MIVPMKKIAIVCLDQDRDKIISGLRDIGVLHVELESSSEIHPNVSARLEEVHEIERSIQILNTAKPTTSKLFTEQELSTEAILSKILEFAAHADLLKARIESTKKDLELLKPWGDFDFTKIKEMENKGVNLYLCHSSNLQSLPPLPEDATIVVCHQEKKEAWFVVLSLIPIEKELLPLATIPEKIRYSEALTLLDETQQELKKINTQLSSLTPFKKQIEELYQQKLEDFEYSENLYGMSQSGILAHISGFIPAESTAKMSEFAKKSGCGFRTEDPETDDQVPTFVKIPKLFQVVKPIFDFIGIIPGYKEWDVSVCLLLFFTLFFAMIVGDAGYGLLFLIGAILGMIFARQNKALQLPLRLFAIFGVATIIWGALNCSWFGISADILENKLGLGILIQIGSVMSIHPSWVRNIDQLATLSDDKMKLLNIEYFCFFIAMLHLGIARIWKTIIYYKNPLNALGNLGWLSVLIGNFFLAVNLVVFPNSFPPWAYYFYFVGAPLALLGINWKSVSDVFNIPFSFINSFVDTLSYIRLYAVGLAGAYIANSFNDMAPQLMNIHPGLVVFTILALFLGHLLNITLCIMSVMVHAVRLNALEFSNHMGIEWSGIAYHPFKRNIDSEDQKPQ